MFENMSYEYILDNMLSKVPDTIDKREGSIIYDALAPAALELANVYMALDMVVEEAYADTASYGYLVKRTAERGILPNQATSAIRKAVFTPVDLDIPIGTKFVLNDLYYFIVDKIQDGEYQLKCETEGEVGNQESGMLLPVDFVKGLETAELTDVLIPGEDEEDEESLRLRYFSSFDLQAFGGNKADYIEKTNAIDGVGGVKVYPAWNGGGTVKLVIINTKYEKPSNVLIDAVQTVIDPALNSGEGLGLAPIGHRVTVMPVEEASIHIKSNITYEVGWSFETCKSNIEKAIDGYFYELRENWSKSENIVLRISQIETRILDCTGVLDISDTSINDIKSNLILNVDEIPIRGDVNG